MQMGGRVFNVVTYEAGTIIDSREVPCGTQTMPDYLQEYLVLYDKRGEEFWTNDTQLQKLDT